MLFAMKLSTMLFSIRPTQSHLASLASRRRFGLLRRCGGAIALGSLTALALGTSTPAQALDTIKLNYGSLLTMDMPLSELETFAKSGKASENLQLLLDLAKLDKTKAQTLLSQEIKLDGKLVDRVLKTYLGEVILQQVGSVVNGATPSGSGAASTGATASAWQELRTAIATAAADNRMTPLEVLRAYKPKVLDINGQKAMDIFGRISKDIEDLKPLLQSPSTASALTDLQQSLCAPGATAPKPGLKPQAGSSTNPQTGAPAKPPVRPGGR